jgi:CRISPR type I-D-associated protein Csc2
MTTKKTEPTTYQQIEEILKGVLDAKFAKFFPAEDYQTLGLPPRDFRISIPCLIETQDYAIFQSEPHRLDKVSFPKGIKYQDKPPMERAECHESKVKQEIRRVGKKLRRKLSDPADIEKGMDSTDKEEKECHIPDCLCGVCRDCRLWGFAASGSTEEREENSRPSKVDVGTAFTIRAVDEIMVERVWNAVDESDRRVRRAVGDKEQLVPQVFLPYVIDLRDASLDEFLYILYSLLNAGRIGAGRTKYGAVDITPLGVYFAYEQLFANKKLTQYAYDYLWDERVNNKTLDENKQRLGWLGDLTSDEARKATQYALSQELAQAACWCKPLDPDDRTTHLQDLLVKATLLFRDEDQLKRIAGVK